MRQFVRDNRWRKPKDKPMPEQPQNQPARGNRTILVIVDTRRPSFRDVQHAVISALWHMGMPYEMWDLSTRPLEENNAREHALLLLAQENIGASVNQQSVRAILVALKAGVGLCSLDPWLDAYPKSLAEALRLTSGKTCTTEKVRFATNKHYITAWRNAKETVLFRKPVPAATLGGKGISLLTDNNGSFMHAGRFGAGKFVWWGFSPKIWFYEYLGHAWGLDDIFWRSIVWAAQKPFVIKAMPPYISMRFDDCSGFGGFWWIIGYTNSVNIPHPKPLQRIINLSFGGQASVLHNFNYVKILNDFGWRPEISLFVDQVSDEDWHHLKGIYDKGNVQVSLHGSFRDGFDAEGKWFSHFVTYKGVECLTEQGVEFRYNLAPRDVHKYMEMKGAIPYCIARYPDLMVKRNLQRLDAIWESHDIKPGATLNMHWRNVPSNALKFFKVRGQTFNMAAGRCNYAHVDPEGYNWRLLPYGDRGMFMDYMPVPEDARSVNPTDFFGFRAHVAPRMPKDPILDNIDFCRCKKEAIPGLLTHRDPELIAQTIIQQSKLGLQSLFFGHPVTHEMNLATFTNEEWRDILQVVEKELTRYPKLFVLHDKIAYTARSKCETHIDAINWNGKFIELSISGAANAPVWLYAFRDEKDTCVERLHRLSPFTGTRQVKIR